MANDNWSPTQTELRRRRVNELVLQRVPYREIAAELNVNLNTVVRDVAWNRAEWRKNWDDDRDQQVHNELENIANLERRCHKSLVNTTDVTEITALVARLTVLSDRRSKILGLEQGPAKNVHGQLPEEYSTDRPIGLRIEVIAPGNRVEVTPDTDDEDPAEEDGEGEE